MNTGRLLACLLPDRCMMKSLYILPLLLFCLNVSAQDLVSSNTTIESCNDQQNCLNVNNSSYLYYDESKNEFYLQVNFGKFRAGADTNDNWLNRIQDTMLYFKAIMPKELFPPLGNQSTKDLKLTGEVFYGGKWRDQPIEMNIFTTESSILNTTNPNTNFRYDNYKVTFSLPFVPKDFKTYKKLYYNDQTVTINVTLGRINLLKPGMEPLLSDVYYQASR